MASLDFTKFYNIIDGQAKPTDSVRHAINPATKENLWPAPLSTPKDVEAAINAAKKAGPAWADVPLEERQKRVAQLAEAVTANAAEFAKLLTLESGKPLAVAEQEVGQAAGVLAGSAKMSLPDRVIEETDEHRLIERFVPIGVCVGIVPWNFPLVLSTFKLGPAVIAGNTIIIKPSPFTPYVGLKLVELAQQFFPPGVVQAIAGGDDLGPQLTEHPGVDKVSFTGSTATGIRVMQSCSKTLKRVTLELGGNDPAIVCADVNIPEVAAKIGTLALYNSGQVCIAIKRIYVHASIYDAFAKELAGFISNFAVGDGMDRANHLGPVQNEMQYNKLKALATSIKDSGLKTVHGDLDKAFTNEKGYFMNPIVIDNPPDDSRIVQDEPFGPIFPLLKWETEDEVVRRANEGDNGLGSSVWSQDRATATRIARRLQAGTTWINTHLELRPDAAFGGVKCSGIGCELGPEGLRAYCNVQTIHGEAKA